MKSDIRRDDFDKKTKDALALRAGHRCSICGAHTSGPGTESIVSVTRIGVAAHMTAASPGGPRYNPSLTSLERCSISNGIWLCPNHAIEIDRDCIAWPVWKLQQRKNQHEEYIRNVLGIPNKKQFQSKKILEKHISKEIIPREFGFVVVGDLNEAYKRFIAPIILDKNLNDSTIMGVLLCRSSNNGSSEAKTGTKWTVFVNYEWLQWFLKGQSLGFKSIQEVPSEQIYGQIPGWPDTFFEFLAAMVQTNTTFEYKRKKDGYLVLAQKTIHAQL